MTRPIENHIYDIFRREWCGATAGWYGTSRCRSGEWRLPVPVARAPRTPLISLQRSRRCIYVWNKARWRHPPWTFRITCPLWREYSGLWNQDDVIKWKHFPHYWSIVRGTHRSPVDSPHKGQWRGALMFSLMCAWTNGWANSPDAGDLRCHGAHCIVTLMVLSQDQ